VYGDLENSWVPATDLNCPDLVTKYHHAADGSSSSGGWGVFLWEMMIEPWTRVRTLHDVYLTRCVPYTTCTRLPSTCPWFYLTRLHQTHRPTSRYTRLWSSHTTYGHPPSHYVFAPHSFYNYFRIRKHHVSNQHVNVILPDH
jgi:hypothetical protein